MCRCRFAYLRLIRRNFPTARLHLPRPPLGDLHSLRVFSFLSLAQVIGASIRVLIVFEPPR